MHRQLNELDFFFNLNFVQTQWFEADVGMCQITSRDYPAEKARDSINIFHIKTALTLWSPWLVGYSLLSWPMCCETLFVPVFFFFPL